MHYALTVLDKVNNTRSDAGPINAGEDIVSVGRALADVLANVSDEVPAQYRARTMGQIMEAMGRRVYGAEYPWDRVTVDADPQAGPAIRVDVHADEGCDCEA